jgi:hypothetical protein
MEYRNKIAIYREAICFKILSERFGGNSRWSEVQLPQNIFLLFHNRLLLHTPQRNANPQMLA